MERILSQVETLSQIDLKSVPDAVFYYTLCLLLLALLAKFITNWVGSNKDRQDQHGDLIREMGRCLTELTTITKVHEVQIQALLKTTEKQSEDIETLRDFYIVTYKK